MPTRSCRDRTTTRASNCSIPPTSPTLSVFSTHPRARLFQRTQRTQRTRRTAGVASLLTAGFVAALSLAVALPVSARTNVPRSCADCRFIRSESGFLTCIERCLAGDVWCGEDRMTLARWEGWKFNQSRSVARRESENDFEALFGERRHGVLEVKLHNGKPAVAFAIPELVFPLHDPTVTVRVEGEKTRTYRGERWSDDILIVTDPELVRAFRRGCRVRVSTIPFGHERVDLQFDLAGFRDAADVVFGGKAP